MKKYTQTLVRNTLYFALAVFLLQVTASASDRSIRKSKPISLGIHTGGFYAGVYFSDFFVMGAYSPGATFNYDTDPKTTDKEGYDQDGLETTSQNALQSKTYMGLRYYPFDNGIFFGASFLTASENKKEYEFDTRERKIGDTKYITDMKIEIKSKNYSGGQAEIGYNYTFSVGFDLSISVVFPNLKRKLENDDIAVTTTASISAADLQKFIDKIKDEENTSIAGVGGNSVVNANMSLGYNF